MMKKLTVLSFALLMIFSFNGCNDDPQKQDTGGGTTLADFTSTSITADPSWDGTTATTDAWAIDQFVDQAAVNTLNGNPTTKEGVVIDTRGLYTVNITGSDGWTPRTSKGAPSMPWAIFKTGYLLPKIYDAKAYWAETSGVSKYWLVKGAKDLDLYRSIVVKVTDVAGGVTTDGERTIVFETEKYLQSITYTDKNSASVTAYGIKLSDLISSNYITTDNRALYDYKFAAADGYEKTYTPTVFDQAYYIAGADNNEKVIFIDGTMNQTAEKSFKWFVSIELVNNTSGTPDGDYDSTATAPTPADTPAYSTSIPQQ